ncbi:hypothetical protein BU25DRAFT_482709 [Macroventuria anomochaeta]|uniref:Uncharacterized protein n=1 Tax=Macroventuria anomochaeta TaxID=301207 RepID=A0ACB6RKN2_9PLEO|nr:uncharacterized protein BU25DRAFT_482709 [Macroventuria anomochaeta]KAF2621534.1 hypothetical protein BU25DRAFT_482709 [Macroventuria anomochaeta]
MIDGDQAGNKLLSKGSRWRTKYFAKDDAAAEEQPKAKRADTFKLNEDVNDFLKPSTEKANAQQQATAAFLAAKPRIDVARAQRWPGAQEILSSAAANGKSPGPGGLRTATRKRGLTVNFARTQPDVIGRGGDECEEPSLEVSRRKKASSVSDVDRLQTQSTQDDANVSARTPQFNGMTRSDSQTSQTAAPRNSFTRTLTNQGEMSPPLQKKLEMGNINTYAHPPPPAPQRMGPMGLGERPKVLSRAPTGFDLMQNEPPAARRPSKDSAYSAFSQDSDNNVSPVAERKAPVLPPTQEEEDDFRPKPLKRSQTGFTDIVDDSDDSSLEQVSSAPQIPRLPEMRFVEQEDDSPLESRALLAERFLQSEPEDPDSFSAKVKHKMRAEEGRALHEAQQRAAEGKRGSDTSSLQSDPFQVGTPPSTYNAYMGGRTPPSAPPVQPSRQSPPQSQPIQPTQQSPPRGLDAEDPYRSRARGPSPGRRPMPPGTFPLDTDPHQPSSSVSTHQSRPSDARSSPGRSEAFSAKPPQSAADELHLNTPSALQPAKPPAQAQPPPPQPKKQGSVSHSQNSFSHSQGSQGSISHPSEPAFTIRPRQDISMRLGGSLARSDTRMLGDAAFKDFAERVIHMNGIFALTAQLGGNIHDRSPTQWARVATWWFLKGRAGMENLIRSRPKTAEPQQERLTQPHVDLAKALWICVEVLPGHPALSQYAGQSEDAKPDVARQAGDIAATEAFEIKNAIFHYMKLLTGSMKKHQSMPPTAALIQGQNQNIWEEYPRFDPIAASVLSGAKYKQTRNGPQSQQPSLSQYLPLTDTKNEFCYFRMFATATMLTDDANTGGAPMPAAITVLRSKEEYATKLAICSQNEDLNLIVGLNAATGPTWKDVSWKKQSRQLSLQLHHGFVLRLELNEGDWRNLWAIVDHTNRVESSMRERANERFSGKLYLREASYKDPANPAAFPPERVHGCKLMVFEKFDRSSEGTGKRKLHRGYRLVLVTAQKNKQLSFVEHELGTKQEPMNFEYVTENDQSPAMRLHFREGAAEQRPRVCTVHLVFQDANDRNHLFGTFTSMNIAPGEMTFAQVPLKSFSIESADQADAFSAVGSRVLEKLQWQEAKTVNQDPEAAGLEAAPTVMSESLRIVCRHSAGIISDRMNLGPGEILVRLPTDGAADLTLLRNPQQDMAVAVDSSRTDKDVPDALAELLRTLTNASTIRRLAFNSFKDLHAFQLAVTGFEVKFDGIASTFSISRRRMVVPIYKQWTANTIRLQIVHQDNVVQLLAFFEDFSHADAMNFRLSSMDTFEKKDSGGKFGLKLVDAKFALPVDQRRGEGKMQKAEGRLTGWVGTKRRFVCLDEIEYPGEHDDILIMFDSAEARDLFADALPAATMERKFTVRRKI